MLSVGRSAIAILLAIGALPATSAVLVTDSQLKAQLIRTAFPSARLGKPRGRPLDWRPSRWPGVHFTDALQGENEFEVLGDPAQDEIAFLPTILDNSEEPKHYARRVRFRAFELRGPSVERRFVALAHYRFEGADHAFCCQWAARLFLIVKKDRIWSETHSSEFLFNRGKTVRSFKVEDINADGFEEVVIEGEESGAPGDLSNWITLYVFDVQGARPIILLKIPVLGMLWPKVKFESFLDRAATEKAHGSKFCFVTARDGGGKLPTSQQRAVRQCFGKGPPVDLTWH